MLSVERHKRIIELVNANGSIRAAELARTLSVTKETIRKDLLSLSSSGLIKRSFGGAVAINEFVEMPLGARALENIDLKAKIAEAALKYLDGNHVIFIDSGSTLVELAKILPSDGRFAIVTNSFEAVRYLMSGRNTMFFIGGEINSVTISTSGFWSTQELRSLRIDVAFLGTSGFQSHGGPCSKLFADAQFKAEVIKNSKLSIVLADHTKFESNAIVQYAEWSDIDVVITDRSASESAIATLSEQVQVVLS